MATHHDVRAWIGHTVVDRDGDKVGKVQDVYLDRHSEEPEWLAVKTGLFGSNVSFVPVQNATTADDDTIRVEHEKDRIKDAPNVDPDGELSTDEERRLYEHYGRSDYDNWSSGADERTGTTDTGDADVTRERTRDRDAGYATSGTGDAEYATSGTGDAEYATSGAGDTATGRDGDAAMTRSEDELHVGTQRREAGRARLRKWVETENVQETVPVRHEEVRVEREPITDANRDAALSGPEITEAEHEVTLHEEEPVVEKRTVPKERVRLDKDVSTAEETVSEEVRRERIEAEGDAEGRL
jgi:uncharacterized protein (TIGR02271 family)